MVIRHGDPETRGDVSVSGTYELGIQDQAFLGPESGLAVPDGEGGVDVYVATQWLHVDRDQVAPCLDLPPEMVRIHLGGVGASFAIGPYAVDNALIESTCVYTNTPPCGAMRGFGAVQTCFAAEAQLDKLAAALQIDPVELRLLNALGPGDVLPTGQRIEGAL